ncbi:MAG: homocysteine S-methyltransferase family protein [Verrucomicrobia bacterium]|nr:homocysteine S-methyltransferase family protein [Verrucomicrobiota bacterium]
MADFLGTLRARPLLADGAMGSYLFKLTGRLSETNHVYEAFNVDQPDLVRRVHTEYLAAGARCLKTNTFGANRVQLRPFGLEPRVAALNRAGVQVARDAIARFQEVHGDAGPFFVLASVGPTNPALATAAEVEACYREQLVTLAAAGADALLLETFGVQSQLELLIGLIRSLPAMPPIIAEMTPKGGEGGHPLEPEPVAFVNRMALLGVPVVGMNCCAPWDASAFVDAAKDAPPVRSGAVQLAVMPNAGGFQRIGNRLMTSVNPELAGKLARSFSDLGVRLLGGCCEMHPEHIEEMHNYLESRRAGERVVAAPASTEAVPVGDAEKRRNGPLSRKLKDGQFVVSIEALPPRGTDDRIVQSKVDFLAQVAKSGLVDAVDFTDGSRGIPLISPGDFIQVIRSRLGWTAEQGDPIELIPHFTARDLNLMGIQSRLVGYHHNRIHNVLFVTGDPPKMSPTYPRSTAVFDLDSIAMIRLTHSCLNAGVDFGGVPLGKEARPHTHFTIGAGVEPESPDPKREFERLQQKLEAGADYIMTQPVFHPGPLQALEKFRGRRPFLIGVMVLANLEHARRMAQVPGVVIPEQLLGRLAARSSVEDQAKVGRDIAAEQIQELVHDGWPGVYLMSTAVGLGTLDVLRAGLGR